MTWKSALLMPGLVATVLTGIGAAGLQAQDAGKMDPGKMMEGATRMMQEGMKTMRQNSMKADGNAAAQKAAGNVDPRTYVELPPEIRARFLATMRGFMQTLDKVSGALAEGNFAEAARIAEDEMGPAHEMMKKLKKMQATPQQVAEIKKRARERFAQVVAESGDKVRPGIGRIAMQVLGKPLPGMKEHKRTAIGPHLPAAMHRMGIQLHLNAADFADVARKVGKQPTVEDYRKVLSAYQEITGMCVACHDAWRVF